jgi:ABC-2 type transport system permease protein
MRINIFRHEMNIRVRSVIIWSLSITALAIFFFSIFPSFAEDAALSNQLVAKLPKEMRDAFGLGKIDMSTILGFLTLVFVFVQLCLAIQAGNFGFGLVSIEETEKTADFLLTRPVSRFQIFTSKLLAAIGSLLITDIIVSLAIFLAITSFKGERTYDTPTLLLLLLSMPIFQLFFLSVGLLISLLVKKVPNVTPFSLGLAFGAYVINAFSGVFGDVKLEYLTPFKHFDPVHIVQNSSFDTRLVLINVAVTVVSLAISYWLYIRRDIHAVS